MEHRKRFFRIAGFAYFVIFLLGIVGVIIINSISASRGTPEQSIGVFSFTGSVFVELSAFALIFFLSQFLLISTERELLGRIDKIDGKLNNIENLNSENTDNLGDLKFQIQEITPDSLQAILFNTIQEIRSKESFRDFLSGSQELLIGGVALKGVFQRRPEEYSENIQRGAKFRFLLLDPESSSVKEIAHSFNSSPELITNDINNALYHLANLQKESVSIEKGRVEIRLLSHSPSYSFLVKNIGGDDAYFQAGLRLYKTGAVSRPEFVLYPEHRWYNVFVDNCQNLWEVSKPWPAGLKAGIVAHRINRLSGEKEFLTVSSRQYPGEWVFPVGDVEENEDFRATAIRECEEESGLKPKIISLLHIMDVSPIASLERFVFFSATIEGGSRLLTEEKRELIWVQSSELKNHIADIFEPVAAKATNM